MSDTSSGNGKVVVNRSMSLYSPGGFARIDLEPLGSTRSGAVTILRFRVRKQSSV
jgi:hypothetical protein